MPGTIYPVYVRVWSPTAGAYAVDCQPSPLVIAKGDQNARIVFLLVDQTIPPEGGPVRFQFPSNSGGGGNNRDEYYGITINGDSNGTVFNGASRDPSGLMVTMNDTNAAAGDFTYTVKVVWGDVTAGHDPGIKNQGP